ncbi:LppP/LprE family lipoprotein [Mycolicibacterium brumae]|uniref:LppP/LprE family lipoprotein n=1 Tax=Mycolicibacterium brumae TaxID=85968 RepID=UPI000A94598E|nr:LppP/LprE family lipoprotein [Mycolicibacterium brumae]RWA20796.1 hypothetical protein MBRU_03795 [Mycolicibacterium brumae DSM 44177]UWW07894.1 LppP/LprE family lipoprotein [Mycolicibacterium brumae]
MRRSLIPAAFAVLLATLTACGSGESTVTMTPDPISAATPAAPNAQSPAPAEPTPEPDADDPCPVDLAAPAIARAVSELKKDPRSGQGWNPEPLAGNYNECAQLSAVIVKANTNSPNPNTRAVLFHQGKYISKGAPETFGFNGIDASQTTGDTVALTFTSQAPGLTSMVKYRWNGSAVELVANTP